MEPEEVKNARLSEFTARYLSLYTKLSDVYGELSDISELVYGLAGDRTNQHCYDACSKLQDEIMKLAILSISENLGNLDNHTEI